MLLLFILSFVFFPLEIQPKPSNDFAVELFIVAGWPVLEPPTAWPDSEGTVLCFPGNCHPAGGDLPQRDGYETNTWYCMDILTDCVTHRNTFHVSLSTSACRAPISLAVIPLSSHISSQGMMQHH